MRFIIFQSPVFYLLEKHKVKQARASATFDFIGKDLPQK